nr:capsid protein [Rat picobirnavirus]
MANSNDKRRFNGKGKKRGRNTDRGRTEKSYNRGDAYDKRERSDDSQYKCDPARGANDISWYTRYPDLAVAAASMPYPYRPGMELPLSQIVQGYPKIKIPGVVAINWVPTIGYGVTNTDPASVVAKQIYSKVRKVYSGSLEADAPDFVVYLAALDSIFTYIGWLKRVYRTVTAYSSMNYATPDQLLEAYGFTAAQATVLRNNKTKLWESINTLIYMSRKFTCPAVMDIFNRHYWLTDNVYADANTMNSQFYVFNLQAVYIYGEYDTPQGVPAAGLGYITISSAVKGHTNDLIDSLYELGDSLISALVDWDDSYTISGYLDRAYEGHPQFIVDLLPNDAVLTPIYNEEVLSQIENMRRITGNFPVTQLAPAVAAVTQDPTTNTVISKLQFSASGVTDELLTRWNDEGRVDALVSIRSDAPTAADTIIATRLTTLCEWSRPTNPTSDTDATINVYCGTEFVTEVRIYGSNVLGTNNSVSTTYTVDLSTQAFTFVADLWNIFNLQQFDWNPGTVVILTENGNPTNVAYSKDLHNTTPITLEMLRNLNRVCLFSEFNAFNF